MSIRTQVLATLLTLAAAFSPSAHSRVQDASPEGQLIRPEAVLAEMNWLAGNWSGAMWGGVFHAYYSTPEGGRILSHSKLIKGEREAFYEFELFEARELVVYLQPFPGGKRADGFRMQSHDPQARLAVFENAEKDYPTRIVYQRVSDDELVITLSDPHGGSDKVERFELSQTKPHGKSALDR